MKNLYLITVFLTSLLIGCREKNDNCTPESTIGNFTAGKQIRMEYDAENNRNIYSIEDGNNMVFEYKHASAQCANTYDDELLETLTFEVDKDAKQFKFVDSQIITSQCFYQQIGTWVYLSHNEIKSGVIEGTQISEGKWKVTTSVWTTPLLSAEAPKKIQFEQLFER
ncbi:MAG: hypothetical protein COW65_13670 [Cytophagales bacterium CG18_big_fil_WC_8_21_14_2_50_42_9]|nr:MAG: hypothetical protein COW65_13670 [Cytophagales bacterium CG18_big_fil_WC_8_21_14_2_50_42_9]